MAAFEDGLYEIAAREVSEHKLAPAIWGRVFSESEGDVAKAQASYIKARVEQLTKLFYGAKDEFLRELWPSIRSGRPFVCPFCSRLATVNKEETDFFVYTFTNAPRRRFFCKACNQELAVEHRPGSGRQSAPVTEPIGTPGQTPTRQLNAMALAGFVLGFIAVFLYYVSVIPILAIIFSAVGLGTSKTGVHSNKWMAIIGLILGIVYTLLSLKEHGYFR